MVMMLLPFTASNEHTARKLTWIAGSRPQVGHTAALIGSWFLLRQRGENVARN